MKNALWCFRKSIYIIQDMCIMFHCLCRTENEKSLSSDASGTDVKSFFSNCNVAALRQLGGGRILLDLCLSLPEFSKIAFKPESSATLISLTSSRCVFELTVLKVANNLTLGYLNPALG